MSISNLQSAHVQGLVKKFTGREQAAILAALRVLDNNPMAPGYSCTRVVSLYGDTSRTIEVGVSGIMVDYKFDIAGLVTIIDIYRPSLRHALKKALRDFSP